MSEKEISKEEVKKVTKPIYFENINIELDYDSLGAKTTMPVLFINPDGSGNHNAIFGAPNAYEHILDINSALYASRCKLNKLANGYFEIKQDKNGVDIKSAEFYNKTLSFNVVNKMLDEIEYNCAIICAGGLYNIVKDFVITKDALPYYSDTIKTILGFSHIRAKFNNFYMRYNRDMLGGYVLFDANAFDNQFNPNHRPQYCKDNNVLNTMLNTKIDILSMLASHYGTFIAEILQSGRYDIAAMCKAYNDTGIEVDFNNGAAWSFVTGCLNEQAQRDIAKMGDIIEISVINALHYFLDNVVYIDYPDPLPKKDSNEEINPFGFGPEITYGEF